MDTIPIPNTRIGSTKIAHILYTTRQSVGRWFLLGLFKTARREVVSDWWTAELWEVLLFHRPDLGCKSKAQRAEFAAPSLSEEQIRLYLAALEE
jgi:hypothetical protein